jgi:hypothetical protein
MTEINDYVRAIFFRDMGGVLALPDGWSRRAELVPGIQSAVQGILDGYSASDVTDAYEFAESMFDEFATRGALQSKEVDFAGAYYKLSPNRLSAVRQKELEANDIHILSEQIGGRFYPDVFAGFRGHHPLLAGRRAMELVPASDRIVTLLDNQVREIEGPISELVEQLDRDNGVPDHPGLKERLSGELKAGRELVRAGSYRAYLLHATLIRALGEIIQRYQGSAIAMVAASLVDLLVKQALGVS